MNVDNFLISSKPVSGISEPGCFYTLFEGDTVTRYQSHQYSTQVYHVNR